MKAAGRSQASRRHRRYPSCITDFGKFGYTDVLFPGMDVRDE